MWGLSALIPSVLQHLFEYGTEDQRRQLAALLLPRMPRLCANSCAVAVIAKGLEHVPAKAQRCIAQVLLQDPARFLQLAALRFGRVAAEAILKVPGPEAAEARSLFVDCKADLSNSRHGRAVLKCFGIGEPKGTQQL